MMVELVFSLRGETIPLDHAYPLYGALSQRIPLFHEADSKLRFNAINGISTGKGLLQLTEHSRLRLRLPSELIPDVLSLAGKQLVVAGSSIRIGVPTVQSLIPATTLIARLVTFKHAEDAEPFLTSARKFLAEKSIHGEPQIPLHETGRHRGQPKRKVIRIKDKTVVGYTLLVEGLSAEESLKLQEEGLGGRTKLGCGFFVAVEKRS